MCRHYYILARSYLLSQLSPFDGRSQLHRKDVHEDRVIRYPPGRAHRKLLHLAVLRHLTTLERHAFVDA